MNSLKMWRLERRLSQYELSEASGVGRWAIQIYELGIRMPKQDEQSALAEALGVPTSELFPIQPTKNYSE